MKSTDIADWISFCRKHCVLGYIFIWCFGLSCGYIFASFAEPIFAPWMYAFITERGSISGLLAVNLFPLFCSIVAIRFRAGIILLPLLLVKSFLIGFCCCNIYYVFYNAGWIVLILYMFSQSFSAVVFLWYLIDNYNQAGQWHIQRSLCCVLACSVVTIFDYLLVIPFLTSLTIS